MHLGEERAWRIAHGVAQSAVQVIEGHVRDAEWLAQREEKVVHGQERLEELGRHIQMLVAIEARVEVGFTGDTKNIVATFGQFKPSLILSVPRVFEKVYNSARQSAADGGKGKIFDAAAETAIAYSEATQSGNAGLVLKLKHTLFDKLVYGKLRAALGGRCEGAISGGAPLGARLGHFFHSLGVTILEGYGLTETTAPATVNLAKKSKIGTVGPVLPGVGVRLAEDGEVEVRGINVFKEYWRNPEATAAAFDGDWFKTGDLGSFDDEGFLSITGRKKEIIVTAGGKNVAPAVLEDPIRANPIVGQVVVVGDQKPFIAALVTLDPEMLPTWLANNGLPGDMSLKDAAAMPTAAMRKPAPQQLAAVNMVRRGPTRSTHVPKTAAESPSMTMAMEKTMPIIVLLVSKCLTSASL